MHSKQACCCQQHWHRCSGACHTHPCDSCIHINVLLVCSFCRSRSRSRERGYRGPPRPHGDSAAPVTEQEQEQQQPPVDGTAASAAAKPKAEVSMVTMQSALQLHMMALCLHHALHHHQSSPEECVLVFCSPLVSWTLQPLSLEELLRKKKEQQERESKVWTVKFP